MITFNKPYVTGKEFEYINEAVNSLQLSGNGKFTKKCHEYFENKYCFKKCLLTTSCTDALEMAAILLDIQPGDEVIIPSYTFVSTANAFELRGATIVFADSSEEHPNIDVDKIEALITSKTKAIVPVHYAGMACDMQKIMELADKYGVFVVEDAAQAIDSYYNNSPLGGIGHLGTFSFHETKNIIAGEGGMLVINDERFIERAEIIWEKGTNRTQFFRGEVDKYGWVDIGSSFLPSEIIAAFLFAQLENLEEIQGKRISIYNNYESQLSTLREFGVALPQLPFGATKNAHMFYLICNDNDERSDLIKFMKSEGVHTVFHYLPLHKSEYFRKKYQGENLNQVVYFSDRLVRLPLYYELTDQDVQRVIDTIIEFYRSRAL